VKIIPFHIILQPEHPDDYIDRVLRAVDEQIRQDNINRRKLWMRQLRDCGIIVLLGAIIWVIAVYLIEGGISL